MTTFAEQAAAWDRIAAAVATALRHYLVVALGTYLPYTCTPRYGRATALVPSTRTVTVTLEPAADGRGSAPTGSTTVQADYGRPTWSAGQIVGKRVRVWETKQWRADDQRLSLSGVGYVVDDVVSR